MNCALISTQLGFKCTPISDGLFYLESPLTLPFDGNVIGAYIQETGNGNVRISDNADTLFAAMTHGVKPAADKGKRLAELVAASGLQLSDDGEIFAACKESQLGFYLARFIEAAQHVGFACNKMRPQVVSRFDRTVGAVLKKAYTSHLKTEYRIIGASGHQLILPFAIESKAGSPTLIQTVSAKNGKVDWSVVYRAVGKMLDIKNAYSNSDRRVILETADAEENLKAITALADAAAVVVYDSPERLLKDLAA